MGQKLQVQFISEITRTVNLIYKERSHKSNYETKYTII